MTIETDVTTPAELASPQEIAELLIAIQRATEALQAMINYTVASYTAMLERDLSGASQH
jgi:hypothetical protein